MCFKCVSEVRINVITDYCKPSLLPLHRQIVVLSSTIFDLSVSNIKVFNGILPHLEKRFLRTISYVCTMYSEAHFAFNAFVLSLYLDFSDVIFIDSMKCY